MSTLRDSIWSNLANTCLAGRCINRFINTRVLSTIYIPLSLIKQPKTITFDDIPSELKEIIIGLALGDLYIRRRNKNTCLCFKQSGHSPSGRFK